MKEYKQLSLEERKELYVMMKNGVDAKAIARQLDRCVSTIKRELDAQN